MHDRNLDAARIWIVGINPGSRSEAVDAPFAHPGNRFWPALHKAGITPYLVDASKGLSLEDATMLSQAGLGFTNIVDRFTPKASDLTDEELRDGGGRLQAKLMRYRPEGMMVAGIGAYRTAFAQPRAVKGPQPAIGETKVWVVGNPSGLNAHETVDTLARSYREAYDALLAHP